MLKWNKSFFLQKLVVAWMRILLTFLISNVSWVLANITSESSHCFRKGNRNSGRRLCIMVCPSFWEDYYMLIYTHCWELMNSVGSHGSSSLPFVMKVMVCHFVSDSHEVMTALIVMLPLIVVVEISLQLHRSVFLWLVFGIDQCGMILFEAGLFFGSRYRIRGALKLPRCFSSQPSSWEYCYLNGVQISILAVKSSLGLLMLETTCTSCWLALRGDVWTIWKAHASYEQTLNLHGTRQVAQDVC
jgi:hypothetical protein